MSAHYACGRNVTNVKPYPLSIPVILSRLQPVRLILEELFLYDRRTKRN